MSTDSRFDASYRVLGRTLLARSPGFERCPETVLDALVRDAELRSLDAGDALFQRGQRCTALSLVVEGVIGASIRTDDGRRHLLTLVLPGHLLGFLSLIDGKPQPHDALAHRRTLVMDIPASTLHHLRSTEPSVRLACELQLVERSRRLYDAMAENMLFPLRERLARQLVALAAVVGVPQGRHWVIDVPLTQADLADLLGAGRQAVNGELRRLQTDGLVRIARSRLEILDLDALRARGPHGIADLAPRTA